MEIINAEGADAVAQADFAVNWNVPAILCSDGESRPSSEPYFDSSSLDGPVSGFCSLVWDSLSTNWEP